MSIMKIYLMNTTKNQNNTKTNSKLVFSAIDKLINKLSDTKPSQEVNFDMLREELLKKDDENKPIYYINLKENDDLAILYYNDLPNISTNTKRNDVAQEIEQNCRSYILEKTTLKPIGSQFNRIIYNNDAKNYLENIDWSKVIVQKCYEGTMLLLYNHNNKWYVSTRRCLNSEESTWIKNTSYRSMFNEAMEGKFKLDDLDKNYCYHFVLVHHKNKNIVNYVDLDKEYKELYHTMTTEKYTLKEIDYKINNGVRKVETIKFKNLDDLLESLDKISKHDETHHTITSEGYVVKVYDCDGPTILKLQTPIYQSIMKIKPNNSNIDQSYLELYQKDKLTDFIPYFTKFNDYITKRIHTAMKNIAKEILDLYHSTRKKKNPHIYNNLTEQYRKVLYGLHGLYINHRKQDFVDGKENLPEEKLSRSINVHDVYHYIKSLPPQELRQIFYERNLLFDNPENIFLNNQCTATVTQTALMFGDIKKNNKNKNI